MLVRQPARGEGLHRELAGQARLAVLNLQAQVFELDGADVPAQGRGRSGRRVGLLLGRRGRAAGEVIDIARTLRIAKIGRANAPRPDAIDHDLAAQQGQDPNRQRRLVDGRELIAAPALGQAQLGHLHRQPREKRQLDRTIDAEFALVVGLHPVDGQALGAIGVECRQQSRGRDDQQEQQRGHGDDDAT